MQLTNDHDLQTNNYIWNNLYYIPLCLPGLDNIISIFVPYEPAAKTACHNFRSRHDLQAFESRLYVYMINSPL